MERLSAATLARARGAIVPGYDRSVPASITHIGVGGFARAHLGVYADDLLRAGWPAAIRGISIRETRAEEQLVAQDGLYTVAEREPGGTTPLRVVGSITSMRSGVDAALDALTDPGTRLVTLTVTEKGYEVDPAELVSVAEPRSAPGVLALALARHRQAGTRPPVLASLDNLLDNGRILRAGVLTVAETLDPTLPAWIREHVRFPSSVVDRMVPATTPADVEEISAALGLLDLGAVTAEHHRSWVIEAVDGLPPLAEVGVAVVGDITPYQRRKLWLLNGPHSATAYGGLLVGRATIATAAEHPAVAAFVRRLTDDVLEVAGLPPDLDPAGFAAEALIRFRNPALGHTCVQVGTDGSRKVPQRLLPIVAERQRRGLTTDRFAVVIATWIAAAAGIPVQGALLPAVDDPAGDALRRATPAQVAAVALGGYEDLQFVAEVSAALQRLVREGAAVLEEPR